MTRLPSVTGKELIAVLRRLGFVVTRVKGSHHLLKHPDNARLRVTVPFHRGDLDRRTPRSIVDQAGTWSGRIPADAPDNAREADCEFAFK